jgi:hypothetical protein
MTAIPNADLVEHVLKYVKHSVSHSDGWTLLNSKEYHHLLRRAEFFEEIDVALDGPWKDTVHVQNETVLPFRGKDLILFPDGTYSLSDTTGG